MFSMSALRTGVEYSPSFWAVRAGYDRENISFGAGVKILKSWELDLAILRNSDLGMSQRISLGYWFGSKNKESKTVEYSKDYLGEYTGNIKAKKYIEALEALQRAIAMQPELSKTMWAERESRLNQIVTELQLNGNTVKQKELSDDGTASEVALESINAYLDGKDIKSFILAHAALGEDSQNSTIESLLNTLSKITGGKIDKKQIMPKRSLLKNKVSQAEEAFFGKRYELSIKQLTEALALDDTNVEVWKMLGSCYYAIGDFTKAKECYAKGLELDPNNKSIKAFMESKGWIKK
jgi:tetratricopeptide (TPR) repeat protein